LGCTAEGRQIGLVLKYPLEPGPTPIAAIPGMAQYLTYFSPLTYGNDLIASAYSGTTHFSPAMDIAMRLVFIPIFQFAANRLYKKFNE
jgi:hypothetical protein